MMLAREFCTAIEYLDLDTDQAASRLCISPEHVIAYGAGTECIPQPVATLLRVAAGLGGTRRLDETEDKGRGVLLRPNKRRMRR